MEREEIERLIVKLSPHVPDSVLAEALGLTEDKVKHIRQKMGILGRKYNEQEVVEKIRQFISQHGGRYKYADLTRMLGLDYMTIKKLILKHGLPMPANRRRGEYSLFRHIISDDEIREAISTISHMYSLTPLSFSSAASVEKTLRLLEELLRLRAARKLANPSILEGDA